MSCLVAWVADLCVRWWSRKGHACSDTPLATLGAEHDTDADEFQYTNAHTLLASALADVDATPPSVLAIAANASYEAPPRPPCDTLTPDYCISLYAAMRERAPPRTTNRALWDTHMRRLFLIGTQCADQLADHPPLDHFRRLAVTEMNFTLETEVLYAHLQLLLDALPSDFETRPRHCGVEYVD